MELGGYHVIETIGDGAFGEVFLAVRSGAAGFRRRVAIKRLRTAVASDPDLVAAFAVEAQICGHLNHPNIIQVHDFIESEQGYLLIMEHLEGIEVGRMLKAFSRRGARLPVATAVSIAVQLADGLDIVHNAKGPDGQSLGLIHRDIKPSNLMLTRSGLLKIMDFGVARVEFARTATGLGLVKGTLQYMAPEQARGEPLTPAVDQFAAGLILASLIIGRTAYASISMAELTDRVRRGDVSRALDVVRERAPEVEPILSRALAANPTDRYPSTSAFAAALGGVDLPVAVDFGDVVTAMMNGDTDDIVEQVGVPLPHSFGKTQQREVARLASLLEPLGTEQEAESLPTASGRTESKAKVASPSSGVPSVGASTRVRSSSGWLWIGGTVAIALLLIVGLFLRGRDGQVAPVVEQGNPASHDSAPLTKSPDSSNNLVETTLPPKPNEGRDAIPSSAAERPGASDSDPGREVGGMNRALEPVTTPLRDRESSRLVQHEASSEGHNVVDKADGAAESSRHGAAPAEPPVEELKSEAVSAKPKVGAGQELPSGTVKLGSWPASQVSLDGVPMPRIGRGRGIALPAGRHTLQLTTFDGQKAKITVDVIAEQAQTLFYSFESGTIEVVERRPLNEGQPSQ